MLKKSISKTIFIVVTILWSALAIASVIEFDVPNAESTLSISINNDGIIVGYTTDSSSTGPAGGFIRSANGEIKLFNISKFNLKSAIPMSINNAGIITGSAFTGHPGAIGFISNADGIISTTFTIPGAM